MTMKRRHQRCDRAGFEGGGSGPYEAVKGKEESFPYDQQKLMQLAAIFAQ